ncbi:hypothetical protein N9B82_00225 [Saprospiraceae bacterium]|nr:hypothetical protein [Saprospiraceae bacterium]
MTFHKYLLILSFILFISCNGPAQVKKLEKPPNVDEVTLPEKDPYFVETFGVNKAEGPKSIVRSSMEDIDGNIWIASWEGIIKYDGKKFINYTNKEGLRRFHVFSTMEDSDGNLWFGTIGGGAYKYDGKTWVNYTINTGLADDSALCFYEDNTGKIWIGTTGGISVYNGMTFQNFTEENGLPNEDINSIVQDDLGIFWFGSRGKAFTYNGEVFSVIEKDEVGPFGNVRTIIKDNAGAMWFGGNDGLWRYFEDQYLQIETNFHGRIYEDAQKNIWTSSETKPGVWKISLYEQKDLIQNKYNPIILKEEEGMFFGINSDRNNDMWICNLEGVYQFDGMEFEDFRNE